MKEFYIFERRNNTGVETVRIIPIDAGHVVMSKESWGAIINDVSYYGRVEIRSILGEVIDKHSGIHADDQIYQNFLLNLPDYQFIVAMKFSMTSQYVYIQYIHNTTHRPLLLRYKALGRSGIWIGTNHINWLTDQSAVQSIEFSDGSHHYDFPSPCIQWQCDFETDPWLMGDVLLESKVDDAVILPIGTMSTNAISYTINTESDGSLRLTFDTYADIGDLIISSGEITVIGCLLDNTLVGKMRKNIVKMALEGNTTDVIYGSDFVGYEESKNPLMGFIIHGVSLAFNQK